jgi:hypothetical protein
MASSPFRLANSTTDPTGYDIVDPEGTRVAWGRGEYAVVAVRAINRYIDGDASGVEVPRCVETLTNGRRCRNLQRNDPEYFAACPDREYIRPYCVRHGNARVRAALSAQPVEQTEEGAR